VTMPAPGPRPDRAPQAKWQQSAGLQHVVSRCSPQLSFIRAARLSGQSAS
jgi:hypothetical protein